MDTASLHHRPLYVWPDGQENGHADTDHDGKEQRQDGPEGPFGIDPAMVVLKGPSEFSAIHGTSPCVTRKPSRTRNPASPTAYTHRTGVVYGY